MKKITMKVNGVSRRFVVDEEKVLLDLLREDLALTGAKQSCDRKGQCGACTVIVDKKAVLSCLTKVADLDGADVITIEGLGTPNNPHLIQNAFVLAGAVQCGFCTPGMIMAAKALLDRNLDPNDEDIKKALRRNLCRCTGYVRIIEAVKLAGKFLRGELTPAQITPDPDGPKIGVSHPRPSAMVKACGVAQFTADIKLDGAAELAVARSTQPHALIRNIDVSKAEKMPGVIGVMTGKDIKGTNRLKYIVPDRPILCVEKVHSLGDPIASVLAETKAQALAAAAAVEVEYEPLPVLRTVEDAMADGAPQVTDAKPNLCFTQPQIVGDAEAALAESPYVVEAHFKTQCNHQAPLEPEACAAYFESDEEGEEPILVVIGRSINIHFHLKMIQEGIGYENMRYEEAFSGGQFGLKIDVTTEGLTAAAALHFNRPVRYIPSLAESMILTAKRHPFFMQVKMGADKDGKLTGYVNDFIVDNGAYYSIGHVVIMRALWMLSGSYYIPGVKATGRLVYTNGPWGAAARGAGPPQANFALETAVDMVARKAGIDPLEFRINNTLQPGQPQSNGIVPDQWPMLGLFEAVRPNYEKARKEAAAFNASSSTVKRGVGIGTGSFGIGMPGDAATASVELNDDGGISVYVAAADPGEGNDSMFMQVAAHMMDLPFDKVRLVTRDTDNTAASGPAAGSRITYMLGGAVVDAINKLKEAMAEAKATTGEQLKAANKPTRYVGTRKIEATAPLSPETGQGSSFESRVHAVQLAEVEVDTATGAVTMKKMTTAADAGTIINPLNVIGQLEGGMDMGAGYALREEFNQETSKDWRTFKFPTFQTSFDMEVITRETPRNRGTLGATGVGEMTLVPTAPAVINAIADATGVYVCELPATPERVKAAMAKAQGGK